MGYMFAGAALLVIGMLLGASILLLMAASRQGGDGEDA